MLSKRLTVIMGVPLIGIAALWVVMSLNQPPRPLMPEPHEELSGGAATIVDQTRNAFSLPAPGLNREQELLFFVGNSFFNQNWVAAPASTTARDGLGPLFNTRSCAGCHFKDGRGRPPAGDGAHSVGFLVRLSIPDPAIPGGTLPEPTYGDQLQDQAIPGVPAEGVVQISYSEEPGTFADGERYSLRRPTYTLTDLAYGPLDPQTLTSPRVSNQMVGLGLLEAVPEATILALADPDDQDGDGISGRPNVVWDVVNQRMTLGRFGWKANQPHLLQQVASAFLGDIGITSGLFPSQNCREGQHQCQEARVGGVLEIDDDDLHKVVLYASSLAVPARRGWDDPQVLAGKELFLEAKCGSCHTSQLQTGDYLLIPSFSHQTIRPYTDLLLHDMGEGLADGRPDFQATAQEWRTPPLWGIGLIETVNGHTNYLHDGRARTLMEAILWHGGEAEAAREFVRRLNKAQRDALIRFLESL